MRFSPFPLLALIVLLSPPLGVPPARASDPVADLPVVATGSGMGNMWLAVKVPAGTHFLVVDWTVRDTTDFFFAQANLFYDEQGDLTDSYGLWAAPTDYAFAHVQAGGLAYAHQDLLPRGGGVSEGRTTLGCPTCPASNATFTYVAIDTKSTGAWNFTVRTSDWTNLSVDSDNTAFLARSRDFNGTLDAQVSPTLVARANLNTTLAFHSQDTLVGFYKTASGRPAPLRSMSIDTPHGTEVCPCSFFDHAAGAGAWGPGDYTFHLTDVDVDTEVVAFGASIRLPS
jgi:hypothetical protein